MAADIALLVNMATPHRIKYTILHAGPGTGVGTVTRNQATMILDCVPGPLKNALSAPGAASNRWLALQTGVPALQVDGGLISLLITPDATAALNAATYGAEFTLGTPNVLTVAMQIAVAVGCNALLEVVFLHSVVD